MKRIRHNIYLIKGPPTFGCIYSFYCIEELPKWVPFIMLKPILLLGKFYKLDLYIVWWNHTVKNKKHLIAIALKPIRTH